MEDQSIVALYLERNERAISESESKYGRFCFTVADRILHNAADSEECVNDTWLKAWNAIPPDQPRSLSAYFGSITRNLAYNRYHHQKRQKRGGNGIDLALEELEAYLPAQETPEDILEEKELAALINRFLATLSPRDRRILLRRYFYLDPVGEIAEAEGKSPRYVGVILNRSLKKLKNFLEKEKRI